MKRPSEREWDRALNIQTGGREDESGGRCMPYEPTPYSVLERLAACGALTSADHLLDCGCGKGRAAFFLAARVGCKATGVDYSEKLIAMAEANRAEFARPERVRFICARAERYAPVDETALYFFNPFSESVLRGVLRQAMAAPRVQRLIFYYPSPACAALLEDTPGLRLAQCVDCRDLFPGNDLRERIEVWERER